MKVFNPFYKEREDVFTRIVIFEKYKPWDGLYKVNVTWTQEMARDLENLHNIDAEAELTALLSEEIFKGVQKSTICQLMDLVNKRSVETRNVLVEKRNKDGTWSCSIPYNFDSIY